MLAFIKRIWSRRLIRIYVETSALNLIFEKFPQGVMEGMRTYLWEEGRELLLSPVTLWEVFVSQDDDLSDALTLFAQQGFSRKLLATPSEIIVRFLTEAYPKNRCNYSEFCDLEMANIWRKMTDDPNIKFDYNKNDLIKKTQYLRALSKKVSQILKYPETEVEDDNDVPYLSLARVVHTYYQALSDDLIKPMRSGEAYQLFLLDREEDVDYQLLDKLVILFVILFMILRMDIDYRIVDDFWKKHGFSDTDLKGKLIFFFERYPEIFRYGPFLQMALVSYYQIKKGGRNRGVLFDSYHAIYASYCNIIVTKDTGFQALQALPFFKKKLHFIEDGAFVADEERKDR